VLASLFTYTEFKYVLITYININLLQPAYRRPLEDELDLILSKNKFIPSS